MCVHVCMMLLVDPPPPSSSLTPSNAQGECATLLPASTLQGQAAPEEKL